MFRAVFVRVPNISSLITGLRTVKPARLLHSPSVIFLFHDFVREMYFARHKAQLVEAMVQPLQSCLEGQGEMEKRLERGKERGGKVTGKNEGMGKGQAGRRRQAGGPPPQGTVHLESRPGLAQTAWHLIPPISGIKCYTNEKRATRQIAVPWNLGERRPCAKLRA